MKVIELIDDIYPLKRQIPFMKLLKSLMAVFYAMLSKRAANMVPLFLVKLKTATSVPDLAVLLYRTLATGRF